MTAMAARIELLLRIQSDLVKAYHPSPSPLFKDGPSRGKNVATTLRRKTPAANAEAA